MINKEQELEARFLDQGFPIKIGTEQFLASTLTDQNYADYTGYIRARYLDLVDITTKNSPNYREQMRLAQENLINVHWSTQIGQDILWTEDGLLNLGYHMCRKKHPNLTFKRFKEAFEVDKVSALDEITKAYMLLNFPLEKKDEGDVGGSPTGNDKSNVQ